MTEGIRISLGLGSPVEEVWEALTLPDRFKAWFSLCKEVELDLAPGGKAVFAGGSGDGSYRSEGAVLDVVPGRKLFHTVLEGYDPTWYGALLWSLEPEGEGTRLVLSEAGFQGREEEIADIEAGWRALLLSLCRYLEKTDRPDLPEEFYQSTGPEFASSFGYTYAPLERCWERILALHGNPELRVLAPCRLIGDMAPPRPGAILDVIERRKLMYTTAEGAWDSVACLFLEHMGSETKISFQRWGYEGRPEELASARKLCDELMDRLVAGLDVVAPQPDVYHGIDTAGYDQSDMEGTDPAAARGAGDTQD